MFGFCFVVFGWFMVSEFCWIYLSTNLTWMLCFVLVSFMGKSWELTWKMSFVVLQIEISWINL